MKNSALLLCALLAFGASSCKRIKPIGPAPISTAQADSIERARQQAMDDSLRAAQARERELERQRQAVQLAAVREAEAIAAITGTVYFDYDQSALSPEARVTLDAKVPALLARPGFRIRITGHTDERGSSEYNLALGLRRAAELKAYLVANGIDAGRIDISSMGEERPAAQGSYEAAWALNRRAEFIQATDEP